MQVGLSHATKRRFTPALATIAQAAALCAALAGGSAHAATLVLFDDFSGTAIDPARWQGDESRQYGGLRVESRRALAAGQLALEAKAYSDNYGNTGAASARNSLILLKSDAVTDLRATFTMTSISALPCTANTTPSRVGARLFGFFFNAGYPTPGSEYNDVYAGIQLYRLSNTTDATGVMHVSAFIGQCTDNECIGSTTVSSLDMGTTTVNTPIALQVSWDKANHRFVFQRDAQTAVNLAYTMSDVMAADYPAKRIEISDQMAECSATRVYSYGRASIDNVMTNALPAAPAVPMMRPVVQPLATNTDETIGSVN